MAIRCSAIGILGVLAGCVAEPKVSLVHAMGAGRHGDVRVYLRDHPIHDRQDRRFLLNRMHLGLATLADGYPNAGNRIFEQIFDTLRTQGINADKTVASIVINEDVKFWKGEPFEQAMAFVYVGLHHAVQGDWANLRAATDNSLFHLRDFGTDDDGRRLDNEALVRKAARGDEDDRMLETYTVRESNFALGYLLSAIANLQLLRQSEANEQFDRALKHGPHLSSLIDALKSDQYNTVLVVDYGQGPRKVGTGPDQSIARFKPVIAGDDAPLLITLNGKTRSVSAVLDLNKLAADHMWNNLEDIRVAKSHLGSIMVGAGVATAASGIDSKDDLLTWLGFGLILGGAAAKSGGHADTRHCRLLPQRVYVAPVQLHTADDRITLQIEGVETSKMVLAGLGPPSGAAAQLRYVRLVWRGTRAPAWARSGAIHYAGEHCPGAVAGDLPYILGGRCVRKPSEQVLASYQRAGYLTRLTLNDLHDLYRAEEIGWNDDDAGAQPGLHVLEGGNSLAAPLPGTAGFARLFGQTHSPYVPKSRRVRELAAQVRSQRSEKSRDRLSSLQLTSDL